MISRLSACRAVAVLVALLVLPAQADAAERRYSVTSFERIRVEGPFEVRLTTNAAPMAQASGDPDALDTLSVSVDGTTLTVRRLIGNGTAAARRAAPLVVTLATPQLRGALVTGGGRLAIAGMKTQRADLAVNGIGALSVEGVATDQLVATIIGTGTMALAGRAQRAQLLTNGSGTIAAPALEVNDLTVRLDGPGRTEALARYTAKVTNTGLGEVKVAGNAACVVQAPAGGAVACGDGAK